MILYILFFLIFNINALTLINLSDSELVNNAHEILNGKIASVSVEKYGKMIVTKYKFDLLSNGVVKSTYLNGANEVYFYILGGELVNNKNQKEKLDVPGLVKLDLNNEYVLFLKKHEALYGLHGLNQGCYRVENVASKKIVVPCAKYIHNHAGKIDDNQSVRFLTLEKFKTKIKEIGGL